MLLLKCYCLRCPQLLLEFNFFSDRYFRAITGLFALERGGNAEHLHIRGVVRVLSKAAQSLTAELTALWAGKTSGASGLKGTAKVRRDTCRIVGEGAKSCRPHGNNDTHISEEVKYRPRYTLNVMVATRIVQ